MIILYVYFLIKHVYVCVFTVNQTLFHPCSLKTPMCQTNVITLSSYVIFYNNDDVIMNIIVLPTGPPTIVLLEVITIRCHLVRRR